MGRRKKRDTGSGGGGGFGAAEIELELGQLADGAEDVVDGEDGLVRWGRVAGREVLGLELADGDVAGGGLEVEVLDEARGAAAAVVVVIVVVAVGGGGGVGCGAFEQGVRDPAVGSRDGPPGPEVQFFVFIVFVVLHLLTFFRDVQVHRQTLERRFCVLFCFEHVEDPAPGAGEDIRVANRGVTGAGAGRWVVPRDAVGVERVSATGGNGAQGGDGGVAAATEQVGGSGTRTVEIGHCCGWRLIGMCVRKSFTVNGALGEAGLMRQWFCFLALASRCIDGCCGIQSPRSVYHVDDDSDRVMKRVLCTQVRTTKAFKGLLYQLCFVETMAVERR